MRGVACAAALMGALAWPSGAAAASAGSSCPVRDAEPVFVAWGDGAQYAAVPGGRFDGQSAWEATGSAGVAEQYNPFAAGDDDESARLAPGSSLTSPPFCADRSIGLRLAARTVETGTHLRIDLVSVDSEGKPDVEKVADLKADDFPTWGLTDRISVSRAVDAGEAKEVRLRLTATNGSGAWLADNVMVQTQPASAKAAAPTPVAGVCPDAGERPVFAGFGDDADYGPAPGGLFDGASSWFTTGTAGVTAGGSPFALDAANAGSLTINPGDTAASPPFCVSRLHPFMRFAARSGSRSTRLRVDVLYTSDTGEAKRARLADFDRDRFRSWALTDRIQLDSCLPDGDSIRSVQLRFAADRGSTVGWLVDDVYVDPVKRG
jgi:hypothetical protein